MVDRTLSAMLRSLGGRVTSLERRLARGGSSIPGRLSPTGEQLTDWNDGTAVGFYWSLSTALNLPPGTSTRRVGWVRATDTTVYQYAVDPAGGAEWVRSWNGVTWTAWSTSTTSHRGTAAQRDAAYGVPATDAARVALANRRPTWFNTDLGWLEEYYAPTGLAGLTALGLTAGVAAGWYPVGEGPAIRLVASAPQSVSGAGQRITAWSAPGVGNSRVRGGAAYFTYLNGFITIVRAGIYRIHAHTLVQAGAGSVILYVISTTPAIGNLGVMTTTLNGTYGVTNTVDVAEVYLPAGTQIFYSSEAGAYGLNQGGNGLQPTAGEFAVRYLRPALVSD
jgi:hypothetical protein